VTAPVLLPAPAYRSHSQLSTYMECGEKYRLKYIEKVKEQPSIWLPGGTAFHTATELFDTGQVDRAGIAAAFTTEFEKEVVAAEEASGMGREEFRTAGRVSKANPDKENFAWWRQQGQDMSLEYTTWRAANPHLEILEWDGRQMIESEFMPILNGVAVKMYLDRLMIDVDTGGPLLVDLKTGTRKLPSLQLGVYRVGVGQLLGLGVDYGAFYWGRKGQLGAPVNIEHWTEARVGQLFQTMDDQVKRGEFLPKISDACGYCGVRSECEYMGDA
jgi:hypothetical protein